jgi:hypothetical protein
MWPKKKKREKRKVPCYHCVDVLLNPQPGAYLHQECLNAWSPNEQRYQQTKKEAWKAHLRNMLFAETFTHNAIMARKETNMLQTGQRVSIRSIGKGKIVASFVANNSWIYTVELDKGGFMTVHEASVNPIEWVPVGEENLCEVPPKEPSAALSLGDTVRWRDDLDEVYTVLNGPGYSIRGKQSGKVYYNVSAEALHALQPDKPKPTTVIFLYKVGDLVRHRNGCMYCITGRRYYEDDRAYGAQYAVGHGTVWFHESELAPW